MSGPTGHAAGEQLGDRINRLRRGAGLSQEELGRRAGVQAVQISKYERGIYAPRTAILGRIAMALDTTADYLLSGQMPVGQDRLAATVSRLDALPAELRAHLFELLEAVFRAHDLTRPQQPASETPQA